MAGVLGDHWALMILREAFLGTRHFGTFQERLGIARNILSGRLRHMVEAGLLERVPCPNDRRVVEYRLTEAGRALHPILIGLAQWSQRWLGEGCDAVRIVERSTGRPIRPLAVLGEGGNPLSIHEIAMLPGEDTDPEMAERYLQAVGSNA